MRRVYRASFSLLPPGGVRVVFWELHKSPHCTVLRAASNTRKCHELRTWNEVSIWSKFHVSLIYLVLKVIFPIQYSLNFKKKSIHILNWNKCILTSSESVLTIIKVNCLFYFISNQWSLPCFYVFIIFIHLAKFSFNLRFHFTTILLRSSKWYPNLIEHQVA